MHIVCVFDGKNRRHIGPFSEREANKLADRLKTRARMLGMLSDVVIGGFARLSISITVHPVERLGTLEAALTFNNNDE